ncbi:MAG: aminotransferase class I/II-fold pyridoxal phosphate-dependent enzyme [Planctomycetota bacterium]
MALFGTVPRRAVNLPPGALGTLIGKSVKGQVIDGPERDEFATKFASWLGAPHVFGATNGRMAFQLALQALDMEPGGEIIFPAFTFPVMPVVAKLLGFKPVFCDVDPTTYNSNAEHFEALITDRTVAVLASHIFGQPAPIEEIAELVGPKGIKLMEDCAHACGVRVGGQSVGTFGDAGVFSFAEGKNMPCFGGGAITLTDDDAAARAARILEGATVPDAKAVKQKARGIWLKWLFTRPWIFATSVYPVLRLKLATGKPLLDAAQGDALITKFERTSTGLSPLVNLQAALGLKQLEHIEKFNAGARRNAEVLSKHIGEVPGVQIPSRVDDDHIYVYYPLTVDADKRDDLRHWLLKRGVDTKTTDMADCAMLAPFVADNPEGRRGPKEASVLEICVYPILSGRQMVKIGRAVRAWAGLPPIGGS